MTAQKPSDTRPIQVAIVEDSAAYRRGLAAVLQMTPGIECLAEYRSGEECLRALAGPAPDVLLMDIHLPHRSGIECAREYKQRHPDTEIVMLTIAEDSARVFAALQAGATGYLLKTATPGEIVEAIRLVRQGGSPMSPAIARSVIDCLHGPAQAQAQDNRPAHRLSNRELQVVECLARGRRLKEIADDLGLSYTTIQTYIRRIYEKLRVHSPAEAIVAVYLDGKIPSPSCLLSSRQAQPVP